VVNLTTDEAGTPRAVPMLFRTGDKVELSFPAAKHATVLAVSDDLLRKAGPECALLEFGILTGPTETRIRRRPGARSVWPWRNDSGAVDQSDAMRQ
jgi:hypothetical protein